MPTSGDGLDIAIISFSASYKAKVEYESSADDPYYYASEVELNPLLTHNPAGFLYISNAPQYPGGLLLNISPSTVAAGQPVLVTARAVDTLGNPVLGELVKIAYFPAGQQIELVRLFTNDGGEVYYEFTPPASGTVVASWGEISSSLPVRVVEPPELPTYLRVGVYPKVAGVGRDVAVVIHLYDYMWRPAQGMVVLRYQDDEGTDVVVDLDVYGSGTYLYRAGGVRRQVLFRVAYNDITAWDVLNQVGA